MMDKLAGVSCELIYTVLQSAFLLCQRPVVFIWFHAVRPDTLTDMANQMNEKVGLVHGLPYVADRQGFAATLEQVREASESVLGHNRHSSDTWGEGMEQSTWDERVCVLEVGSSGSGGAGEDAVV